MWGTGVGWLAASGGYGLWGLLVEVALKADLGQAFEPAREVPVRGAEDGADDGGVEDYGDTEAEAHLLKGYEVTEGEAGEDGEHDEGCAGDDAAGGAEDQQQEDEAEGEHHADDNGRVVAGHLGDIDIGGAEARDAGGGGGGVVVDIIGEDYDFDR